MNKSAILKKGQNFIEKSGSYRLFNPFSSAFYKLYYVSKFASWKKKYRAQIPFKGFTDRFALYDNIIKSEGLNNINFLEFGVSKGESMRWWTKQVTDNNAAFYGFDTFEGIPEDWGTRKKGAYTNDSNIPDIADSRLTFKKGLFQDTLPAFVKEFNPNNRLVIHLDADLYSSTIYALIMLSPFIVKNTILIFDEFNVTTHEFRAFLDYNAVFRNDIEVLGESNGFTKVVIKII